MPEQISTSTDARIILQLYELRRETELRKARMYVESNFWPQTWDDFAAVAGAWGTQENTWVRQVISYWEMAASLVINGALNPKLFHDNNGEMFFLYAKIKPFLKQARQTYESPEFLKNIEQVVEGSIEGRERSRRMQEGLAKWVAEMRAKAGIGKSETKAA